MLRRMSTMATSRTNRCSPFTQAVVNSMRKLYPESLAEKSFDNTGLLLEAPCNPTQRLNNSVLLTVDLTRAVADEAIRRKDSVVVAYHPIIFRGLKSITLNDPQQNSLLRLAQEGISVYSPHTAVDAVPGGMADWLCDVMAAPTRSETAQDSPSSGGDGRSLRAAEQTSPEAQQSHQQSQAEQQPQQPQQAPPLPPRRTDTTSIIPHTRTTLYPNPSPPPDFEDAGMGRLMTFATPQPLTKLMSRLAWGASGNNIASLAALKSFPIALPQNLTSPEAPTTTSNLPNMLIYTVATCPGSGSSILLKNGIPAADLLVTGELSHHDALAATERGSAVVTLFHSNSERGYLDQVMGSKLKETLAVELEETGQPLVEVAMSQVDRDPYLVFDELADRV